MLIEFSKDLAHEVPGMGDWRYAIVNGMAKLSGISADIKWARGPHGDGKHRVRFTLPDASDAQHDTFINAIYRMDPWAMVKTARATYSDCEDFLAQKAARV